MGGDPPHADLCTACVRAVSPQRNAPCGIEHEHGRRGTCASVHNRLDVARMSASEHHVCKMSQGISVSELQIPRPARIVFAPARRGPISIFRHSDFKDGDLRGSALYERVRSKGAVLWSMADVEWSDGAQAAPASSSKHGARPNKHVELSSSRIRKFVGHS